ncbi:MAG: glucokinase, partial [Colwellia sp.]
MNTNLPSTEKRIINLIADIGGTNIRLAQASAITDNSDITDKSDKS